VVITRDSDEDVSRNPGSSPGSAFRCVFASIYLSHMFFKGLAILFWVFFIHLIGIALFTRGFLSTRLSLSEFSNCSNPQCTLPPTYTRAVILIIDALRFDFLSPHPPQPNSPFHHNVLILPREMTARYPRHSLLFNAYADPPTTTLQRIKGLTTGSLSSFVEIGSNFGGYTVEEDSIVHQLRADGKRVSCAVIFSFRSPFSHWKSKDCVHRRRYLDDRISTFIRAQYDVSLRLLQRRRPALCG
jgi:hypothetical protein